MKISVELTLTPLSDHYESIIKDFIKSLRQSEFKIIETGKSEKFDISSYKKSNMSNGFDDIDYLINKKQEISKFANNSPY